MDFRRAGRQLGQRFLNLWKGNREKRENPQPPRPSVDRRRVDVYRGPQPIPGGWQTMDVRDRYPDLPAGVSRLVEEAGATVLLPDRPQFQGNAFKAVAVSMGDKVVIFQNYDLDKFKIGRAGNNNLILESVHTSRRHATIYIEDGRIKFRDYSLNASQVAGETYKNAAIEIPLTPTRISLAPDYEFEVSHDGQGNLSLRILSLEGQNAKVQKRRYRYWLRRHYELTSRDGRLEGYYLSPHQEGAQQTELSHIYWAVPRRGEFDPVSQGFLEAKRIDDPEIIDDQT